MPNTPRESDPEPSRRSAAGSKKRYEAPRLTDYGPVSKLTQSGGGTIMDAKTMQLCL